MSSCVPTSPTEVIRRRSWPVGLELDVKLEVELEVEVGDEVGVGVGVEIGGEVSGGVGIEAELEVVGNKTKIEKKERTIFVNREASVFTSQEQRLFISNTKWFRRTMRTSWRRLQFGGRDGWTRGYFDV